MIVAQDEVSIQGLCIWFNCQFPTKPQSDVVELSTSPFDEDTHWKQTVIVLPETKEMEAGEPIAWNLNISKEENQRK